MYNNVMNVIWCNVIGVCARNIYIWVNYNDLTATSLEIMISKGNHPKMALIQVSEILEFTHIYIMIFRFYGD